MLCFKAGSPEEDDFADELMRGVVEFGGRPGRSGQLLVIGENETEAKASQTDRINPIRQRPSADPLG